MKKAALLTALVFALVGITGCSGGTTSTTTTTTTVIGDTGAPMILGTSLGQGRIEVTTNRAATCAFSYVKDGVPGSVTLAATSTPNLYSTPLASGSYGKAKLACTNAVGTTVDSTYNGGNITVKI